MKNINSDNREAAAYYTGDLYIDRLYREGDCGIEVTLIQEWLCLRNINVAIDSVFGPATKRGVEMFQGRSGICSDGAVGRATFAMLIRPMTNSISFLPSRTANLREAVVACAKRHLMNNPREVGGPNNGPWVRLYMDGRQGLPWCAGFVSFILKQVSGAISAKLPFGTSFSCDRLAANAIAEGLFREGRDIADKSRIAPGALFLCKKSNNDWIHIGIVTRAESEQFYTIEGNANDNGNRDGFEVCERIRSYAGKDFIIY